ncbi:MAG TPA: hypothetical protein VGO16_18620 [Pseudonocardiaceae bacterium]|nr:hypothetical protein [Pseudonocardiaceae bacterium]
MNMMGVIIALLAVGFLLGAIAIVKGLLVLGIIGFGLFLISLVYGAVLSAR